MTIEPLCKQAKIASRTLARISTDQKNAAIVKIADEIWKERADILSANQKDVNAARTSGAQDYFLDRLMLNERRLTNIISDLRHVIDLSDPVGEIFEEQILPNGMKMYKQRVPLGVLAVIYEARPNVTVDVAGLALKSGNSAVLRGGSETIFTNRALADSIRRGLKESEVPADAIQLVTDTDRQLVFDLLQMDQYVDMVIPRGGASLHDFCRKNSRIPVITGGIGICHLFVDESADQLRAIEVIRNAKIQRPSVCNALDTILVHEAIAPVFLPTLINQLMHDNVRFIADENAFLLTSQIGGETVSLAGPQDFDTEWLSLVLGIKLVKGIDEAVDHITEHSTSHSDGILTENEQNALRFISEVDSAVVYVNASTRYTDGAQMGLGAEVAVSTQRMHARGPMGLRELTTYKWVIKGNYHVRP